MYPLIPVTVTWWAVSCYAKLGSGAAHVAEVITSGGLDAEQARTEAMRLCVKKFKPDQGWYDHGVSLMGFDITAESSFTKPAYGKEGQP